MADQDGWVEEFPGAITVTSADGTILAMNRLAAETFAAEGGRTLIGGNVFDCHPEPARTRTERLYREQTANQYPLRKNGKKKIIHQLPWFSGGVFAGFVEISLPIPEELPHFNRDAG